MKLMKINNNQQRNISRKVPELAYRLRVAQSTLMDVPIFFDILSLYMFVYHIFMTSLLWLAVGLQSL